MLLGRSGIPESLVALPALCGEWRIHVRVIGIWWYIFGRVHNNDIVLLSFLGYHVFHCGHFLGRDLGVFIDFEHYMKSEDPDKWLSPEAVQMGADCPALKAVEFNSLSL